MNTIKVEDAIKLLQSFDPKADLILYESDSDNGETLYSNFEICEETAYFYPDPQNPRFISERRFNEGKRRYQSAIPKTVVMIR